MEELIARQSNTIAQYQIIKINFSKDSASRKTADYIRKRLDAIDNLWGEFAQNHEEISKGQGTSKQDYLTAEIYETGRELYNELKHAISSYGRVSEKATMPEGKVEELLSLQRAQFRAFDRQIKSIDLVNIEEKWEIEDELKNIQKKWKAIDILHIQIDNIISGGDITYEDEFIKQSSFELRRMYDTTNECIHAIHNLGVDTPAWDPLIVHLLCKKLDPVTYTDFKESRKAPRELATFEEFMTFLENKFMALEPVYRKEKEVPSTSSSNHQIKQRANPYQTKTPYNKQPYSQTDKNYQVMATNIARCSLCKMDHDLFACKQFIEMTPNARLKSVHTLQVCKNCLYKHNGKPCTSSKRCKECNGKHNTMLHDPARVSSSVPTSKANQNNIYHVGLEAKETLLPTAVVNMRAADGTLVKIRALLDQAAQVSIISENLVQILGLKRYNSKISSPITGIDLCQKKCNGAVSVEIESMYHDYHYQTEALIVSK
ncbi:Uncharacterized protein OBRU01_26357, partial [Operophtera brumata]